MILACSSLSSLACGQLLIISAWHQLFFACGKVWRLEPHEPVRGLHISARGSVNLFSTQLKLSRRRRNMRPEALITRASSRAYQCALTLARDSHLAPPRTWLALRVASRLPSFDRKTLKNYAWFAGISCIEWYSPSSAINHCKARRWNLK